MEASLKAAAAALGSANLTAAGAKNIEVKRSDQSYPEIVTPTFPGKVTGSPKVFIRDQMRCSFKGSVGKVCGSERSLEIHHLKPWSFGGDHSLSNLQSLCHAHHKYGHRGDVFRA